MPRPILLAATVALALLLFPPGASADTLVLKSGAKFEGKLVKETSTHYIFKIRGMGEQSFKKSDVVKIVKSEGPEDVYAKRLKALKKDDAEGFFKLGLYCKENKLRKEARACFRKAVEADPDHAGARHELGYVNYHGDWVTKRKYEALTAELAKKEEGILAGLKLADEPVQDAALRYYLRGPAGWKAEKGDRGVHFEGPELGFAPVSIAMTVLSDAGDLDKLAKKTLTELKEDHEGLAAKGEPTEMTLAGRPAKVLANTYTTEDLQPWPVRMERRDVLMVSPALSVRIEIECADGYYEKLAPFLSKVLGSLRVLDKPLDLMAEEFGFGLAFPDDTYEKGDGSLPVNIQFNDPNGGSTKLGVTVPCVSVKLKEGMTALLVHAGKKGDGKADATSNETLKASLPKMLSIPQIMQLAPTSRTVTIDGVEALSGEFQIMGGAFGRGYYCVFTKGDRYYRMIFITLINQMGRTFMKKDFDKFVAGFKFL